MKRRRDKDRFALHSALHWARHHPATEAEKTTAVRWWLMEMGGRICRCARWWADKQLDEEAALLGVTIIRAGEHALDVCPRCALLAQLLGVLEARIQGTQLSLF